MKTLKLILAAMLIMAGASACSNKDEAARVAEKIEKGDPLTQGDYTAMIKYVGDFATKAQPVQNRINNMSADNPEASRLTAQIDSMRNTLPYLELFTGTICKASQSEIGKDNVDLVNKYAPLEWFTSPDWATVSELPGVAGEIVETPAPGQDTAVVAGAVDQEVVHNL